MKVIDNITFSQFARNELPPEIMAKVEKELIVSKEINATFHTLIQEYHERRDIVDLIGEDEEGNNIWSEREKKFQEECEKIPVYVSTVLNHKTNMNMNNFKLTSEDLTKVIERYNALTSTNNPKLSLSENLINFYLKLRSNATNEEASELVSKLMDGCDTLTLKYNEALKNGFNPEKKLADICTNMTVEQRFTFLTNASAMVEALNLSSFSSQTDVKEAVKKNIEDYIAATPNPTETDCDVMQKFLAEAITNNTLVLSGTEKAHELLRVASKDAAQVVDFTAEQYDDARLKAEMALATWVEYEEGTLKSIEKSAIPEVIGIGAATAIEEAKVMNDVANGSKTIDIAVKCLKILGGIALTCLLGYIAILGCAYMGGMVALGLLSLFGTSTIACIVTMALVIPMLWGVAQLGSNGVSYIVEEAGKVFDVIIENLRESIFPKIAEVTNKFVTWIKSKLGGSTSNAPIVATT